MSQDSIKEMIRDGKKVKFLFYKNGEFWYETETGFRFPVPLSDVGDAMLLPEDKAILFMRYIRTQLTLQGEERKRILEANKDLPAELLIAG